MTCGQTLIHTIQGDSILLRQTLRSDRSINKKRFLLNNLCPVTSRFKVIAENGIARAYTPLSLVQCLNDKPRDCCAAVTRFYVRR